MSFPDPLSELVIMGFDEVQQPTKIILALSDFFLNKILLGFMTAMFRL